MNKKYFEDEELDLLFDRWIDGAPDSLSGLDQERWGEFILALLDKNGEIDESMLERLVDGHLDESNWEYYMNKARGMEQLYLLLYKYRRIKD